MYISISISIYTPFSFPRSTAYDTRSVAAALVETLVLGERERPAYVRLAKMRERWGLNPADCSCGEEYVNALAEVRCNPIYLSLVSLSVSLSVFINIYTCIYIYIYLWDSTRPTAPAAKSM